MKYVYVLGDVHGNFAALKQVFEKSDFTSEDTLIFLGDVVDGPQSKGIKESVEFLTKIKNVISIRGNHDEWFWEWLKYEGEFHNYVWLSQGGNQTLFSYSHYSLVPLSHIMFFKKQIYYYLLNNILFVHGGLVNPSDKVEETSNYNLMWSREITAWAKKNKAEHYKHVYAGHTTTELINNTTLPATFNNVSFLDTGAGWRGKLTLAKINTNTGLIVDFWQD